MQVTKVIHFVYMYIWVGVFYEEVYMHCLFEHGSYI